MNEDPMFAEKCYLMVESDPQTYEEVVGDPRWKTAMKEEFSSLQKSNMGASGSSPMEEVSSV